MGAHPRTRPAGHAIRHRAVSTQQAEATARLRELVAYAPLGVSPALRAQGLDGAYGTALGAFDAAH